MKIRNGFVSNSSSSSFIIYVKDESMSLEELKAKTIRTMENSREPDEEEREWNLNRAQQIAEEGRYMALKTRVERGSEEAINDIIPKILEIFGIEKDKLTYEFIE